MARSRRTVVPVLVLVIAFLGWVVGCASAPTTLSGPTPARAFLNAGEDPEPGYGAYGYLLLSRRPGPMLTERYQAVCDAFVRNLEPVSDFDPAARSNLMPTYWPVTRRITPQATAADCPMMLEAYDFARARTLLGTVDKLGVNGPVLVAWSSPQPRPGQDVLVLDLSDFSEDDFDRAFGIWQRRIARDPSVWNDGFALVRIREAFRNFVAVYGETILEVVGSRSG